MPPEWPRPHAYVYAPLQARSGPWLEELEIMQVVGEKAELEALGFDLSDKVEEMVLEDDYLV